MKQWKLKLLPLQMILAVLPLVLYLYVGSSGYAEYPWNSTDDVYLDIFLHGKMAVFLILAAVLLCAVLFKLIKLDRQKRKQSLCRFLPLFVYLFFVLLSTVCSGTISYSLFGAMDAKEPTAVLMGYVVVALYAYLAIESAEDMRQLTAAAVAGSFCMAVIGVLQAAGKDPLLLEGIQRLFAGNEFIDTYGTLQLTFPVGMAYGTLFNPNYTGTYVVMYAPLLILGAVIYSAVWKKVVCVGTLFGLLVMLFASQSRTGMAAAFAAVVILVVFLGRRFLKRWYFILPGAVLIAAAFVWIDAGRDFLMINRLKEMFEIKESEDPVRGIDTTGNGVRVLYKDTEFTVMMPVSVSGFSYVAVEGDSQKEITYSDDKSYGYFALSTGDEIEIQTAVYENSYAFGLEVNGRSFYFTNQLVKGDYKYINAVGRLDECTIPDNAFPGYETAASGRGYVWGRTLPLLLDNIIIGSGPDTFAVEFPQNDYVARYRNDFVNIIFTRPHSFYLQMGVQTGMVSLIAFLVFYGMYFLESCKTYYLCKYKTTEEQMGFALFLCTVGFMAAGLANDSLIVVTPVFYLLLGAGMAINRKVKNSKEEGM